MNSLNTQFPFAIDGRVGALEVSSREISRVMTGLRAPLTPANWNSVSPLGSTCNVTSQQFIQVILDLPNGASLNRIDVYIRGASGHSAFPGGKPATMPTAILYRQAYTATAPTQISTTATDGSNTAAGFEGPAVHILSSDIIAGPTFGGFAETVDNSTYTYFVSIGTEGGANSIAGDIIGPVVCRFVVTKLDEA